MTKKNKNLNSVISFQKPIYFKYYVCYPFRRTPLLLSPPLPLALMAQCPTSNWKKANWCPARWCSCVPSTTRRRHGGNSAFCLQGCLLASPSFIFFDRYIFLNMASIYPGHPCANGPYNSFAKIPNYAIPLQINSHIHITYTLTVWQIAFFFLFGSRGFLCSP